MTPGRSVIFSIPFTSQCKLHVIFSHHSANLDHVMIVLYRGVGGKMSTQALMIAKKTVRGISPA